MACVRARGADVCPQLPGYHSVLLMGVAWSQDQTQQDADVFPAPFAGPDLLQSGTGPALAPQGDGYPNPEPRAQHHGAEQPGCGSSSQPLAGPEEGTGPREAPGHVLVVAIAPCWEAEHGVPPGPAASPHLGITAAVPAASAGCSGPRSRRKKCSVSLLRAFNSCFQRPFEHLAPL